MLQQPIKSIVFALVLLCSSMAHATVTKEAPENPDVQGRYMFLMFGLQTEFMGPDSFNQMYQKRYETTAISKAFADSGYHVISEIRPRNANEELYGKKVATAVNKLITQGVKPSNIVVAGHSKGAVIAMVSAGMISHPEVKYVVMAGCALPSTTRLANVNPRQMYLALTEKFAPAAKGKMLSVYDKEDAEFQSCHEFGKVATGIKLSEQVIETGAPAGKGHAAFYSPDPKWMSVVNQWLKE